MYPLKKVSLIAGHLWIAGSETHSRNETCVMPDDHSASILARVGFCKPTKQCYSVLYLTKWRVPVLIVARVNSLGSAKLNVNQDIAVNRPTRKKYCFIENHKSKKTPSTCSLTASIRSKLRAPLRNHVVCSSLPPFVFSLNRSMILMNSLHENCRNIYNCLLLLHDNFQSNHSIASLVNWLLHQ